MHFSGDTQQCLAGLRKLQTVAAASGDELSQNILHSRQPVAYGIDRTARADCTGPDAAGLGDVQKELEIRPVDLLEIGPEGRRNSLPKRSTRKTPLA
jgi:hypothetical protein